ncbi:MFS transporter [Streptomyces lusitanus]|uniref:MFS transporter n=1 Tax=Streptomyces lusitanus TaxID=68232 RepID=A0ABU3JML2_9ACTN|nr:MFS transporter [Streptomyces lusitanus]
MSVSAKPPSRWGVLTQRDFRLLFVGETASGLGNGITAVALPLVAVLTLHATALEVGLLAAAVWVPWLVVGLPAGAWVDRLPRRRIMVVCNLVSAAMYASVPVAGWIDRLTLTHLFVVAVACGTSAVFFNTACHAYVPSILVQSDLADGNAKLQVSEAGTRVMGRSAAGFTAQAVGATTGLLLDALTFLVSTACLLGIRAREEKPARQGGTSSSLVHETGEGLRFLSRDPYLRPIVVYGATLNLLLMGYQAVQIVFLVRTVGVGAGAVGLLVMCSSLGGVLGALLATRLCRRWGTARALVLTQAVACPFALLLPLTTPGPGLLFFVSGAFVLGVGVSVANVVVGTFRQSYCPPYLLGRVSSASMATNQGTIAIGSALGGFLGSVIGTRPTLWVLTAPLALTWLLLAFSSAGKARELPLAVNPERRTGPTADAPSPA